MVSSYFTQSAFAGMTSLFASNGGLFAASQYAYQSRYGASTYIPTASSYFPGVISSSTYSGFASGSYLNFAPQQPSPAPVQSGLSQYLPMMMAMLSRRNEYSAPAVYSPPRTYSAPAQVSSVPTSQGTVNTMQGGRGNNTFVQANQNYATNYINGNVRRDRVTSNNNHSTNIINTGRGRDRVYATGNANTNVINTGSGRDLVTQAGTNNTSTINTGRGRDVVQLTGNNNTVAVNLGRGNDRIRIGGTNGTYTIDGGAGRDVAVLSGTAANWVHSGNVWSNAGSNTKVTLNNIEKVRFNPKIT